LLWMIAGELMMMMMMLAALLAELMAGCLGPD
jgi:hypothetical protein